MAGRKAVYDSYTEKTRNILDGGRNSYKVNQIYKSSDDKWYYYINQRGYYHILIPEKDRYSKGKYVISDYLLTADNILQNAGDRGTFESKQACFAALEAELQEGNNAESN